MSEYAQEIQAAFDAIFPRVLPLFERTAVYDSEEFRFIVYTRVLKVPWRLQVRVQVDLQRSKFTLELASSQDELLPKLVTKSRLMSEKNLLLRSPFRIRLGLLSHGRDVWWNDGKPVPGERAKNCDAFLEALGAGKGAEESWNQYSRRLSEILASGMPNADRVTSEVAHACASLAEFGIPLFKEIAEANGLAL